MQRLSLTRVISCALLLTLAACGSPSEQSAANTQATIAAGVNATVAAQASAAPTAAALPSTVPTVQTTVQPLNATPAQPAATSASTTAAATPATGAATAPASGAISDIAPATTPVTFGGQTNATKQPTVNIQLVFDASGSMAEQIGGQTKIQAARAAMENVIAQLPDNAPNFNVGFRVYGHKGDSTDAGKAVSCRSTELLVPIKGIDKTLLKQQASTYEPTGWTPISLALEESGKSFQAGENVKNIIIMVTDGEETCGGDPCAVAKALRESGAEVRIDLVGLGTTPEQDSKLRCIAENGGGVFASAQSADALVQSMQQLIQATVQRSYLTILAVGPDGQQLTEKQKWQGVVLATDLKDAQGQSVLKGSGQLSGEGRRTTLEDTGKQSFELEPGSYSFGLTQNIGWNELRGNLPLANAVQTYTVQIAAGQEVVAVVGVGALRMQKSGGEDEYACDLQLDVALDGKWQPAYKAVDGFCGRDPDGRIVQGGDLSFNRDYPLLPGRYRLWDVRRKILISDAIEIQPGKTVTVQIQGQTRSK